MLGPIRCTVQGKTIRKRPHPVDLTLQRICVLRYIMKFYINTELSADVMFVNDVPFVASISENVHYGTVGAVNNMRCMFL